MEVIGIEDARKSLGDIANRADLAGQTTYLTRNGRPVAAVVPTLYSRYRTTARRTADVPEPPSHALRFDDSGVPETWSCACGAGGVETDTTSAYEQSHDHQRAEAGPLLRSVNAQQLGELLRRSSGDNWRTGAAIELLIAHGHWLYDTDLRDYLRAEWSYDGHFAVHVEWRAVAVAVDLFDRAVTTLRTAGIGSDLLEPIQQADDERPRDRGTLDGSTSELAILRLAASIAGGLPVDLFDDTTSLDEDARGWVLTAIGHLLSRGGGLAFDAARAWPISSTASQAGQQR